MFYGNSCGQKFGRVIGERILVDRLWMWLWIQESRYKVVGYLTRMVLGVYKKESLKDSTRRVQEKERVCKSFVDIKENFLCKQKELSVDREIFFVDTEREKKKVTVDEESFLQIEREKEKFYCRQREFDVDKESLQKLIVDIERKDIVVDEV